MNNSKIEIDAIVFDFDGVLAESVNIKGDAFVELYSNESLEIQKQVLTFHEEHGGVTRYDKIRYYESSLCGRNASQKNVTALANRFSNIVEESVVKSPWVIGAKEFLENFHLKYPLYIASATPQDELIRITQKRNMNLYFKAIYGAPKRKCEHLSTIISDDNYKPERILMVGDAMTDYSAAKKIGTQFIGRKLSNQVAPFPDGTILINNLTELEELIKLKS